MPISIKPTEYKQYALATFIFCFICFLAWLYRDPTLATHWYSIIPPLLAVVLAFASKRLLLSLVIATLVGGLLTQVPGQSDQPMSYVHGSGQTLNYWFSAITDSWNLQVLAFVLLILALISVIIVAGGLKAIVVYLLRFAQTVKSTQLTTACLGLAIFIDDYANTMIVGSAMRPVTDDFKISREKLAFLIDATAAPVAGLAIISTWIGFEVGLFGKVSQSLSLGQDGYAMFFDALMFRFYCILMLIFVFLSIFMQRDFGPMYTAENRARTSGHTHRNIDTSLQKLQFTLTEPDAHAHAKAISALLPLGSLLFILLAGLWIDGGGLHKLNQSWLAIFSLSDWRDVISQAKHNTAILVLAALIGLLLAMACAKWVAKLNNSSIKNAALTGVRSSLFPMFLLVLAWSLKSACDDLNTAEFLVGIFSEVLSPLWFPALLFLIAALTSFSTGTSWGTMAILIPTTIPLAVELDGGMYGLVTMISLGAVLDGSIFGDHCSPISDTTIMSSIASQCDHLDHVRTQIPYSISVAAVALLCGYLPSAFGLNWFMALSIAIALLFLILLGFGKKPSLA